MKKTTLESKFQNRRITDCRSQKRQSANKRLISCLYNNRCADGADLNGMQTLCRRIIQQQHIPVGSIPALPPCKMKPWRSPAPCAATMSAAWKTRSDRGDRGNILDGRWYCRPELGNSWKQMEKNIYGTNPPRLGGTCVSLRNALSDLCCYSGYSQQRDVILMIPLGNQINWVIVYESAQNVPTRVRKFTVGFAESSEHKRAVRKENTPKVDRCTPAKRQVTNPY